MGALHRLQWAEEKREFITGLIYFDPDRQNLAEESRLGDTALAHLPDEKIRPSAEALADIMSSLQ